MLGIEIVTMLPLEKVLTDWNVTTSELIAKLVITADAGLLVSEVV